MKMERTFQSNLADEITRYISFKRALKRDFESSSIILFNLDRFLYNLGKPSADLTAETFRQWCETMLGVSPNTRIGRMRVVRNFCLYRRRSHPACFVPGLARFQESYPKTEPYLYSDVDVAKLLHYSPYIRSGLLCAAQPLAWP